MVPGSLIRMLVLGLREGGQLAPVTAQGRAAPPLANMGTARRGGRLVRSEPNQAIETRLQGVTGAMAEAIRIGS